MLHLDQCWNYILFNLTEKKMDWKINQATQRCFIDSFGSLFTVSVHFKAARKIQNVASTDTFLYVFPV